jgi:hypothetical protein
VALRNNAREHGTIGRIALMTHIVMHIAPSRTLLQRNGMPRKPQAKKSPPTYRRDNEEVTAAGGVENGLERASRCAGVVLIAQRLDLRNWPRQHSVPASITFI